MRCKLAITLQCRALVEFGATEASISARGRAVDRRAFVRRSCLGGVALLLDHWGTSPAYSQDLIPPAPPIHVNEPAGTAVSSLRMPVLCPRPSAALPYERSIVANLFSPPTVS